MTGQPIHLVAGLSHVCTHASVMRKAGARTDTKMKGLSPHSFPPHTATAKLSTMKNMARGNANSVKCGGRQQVSFGREYDHSSALLLSLLLGAGLGDWPALSVKDSVGSLLTCIQHRNTRTECRWKRHVV